ncbi:MAG: acylneuraminate cytidylyltransferase [Nitrospinota bacterium]|nr:MAG: acylneuraminate cytidylyltransferase [Nitrospinota bacterium]
MKRVLIVQARMTSTRLPGKVLLDLCGRPMLAQQLRRLKRCQRADEIVVATTGQVTDDPVVRLAEQEGVRWFRGEEEDVLSRYLGAAREAGADIVVRITADCPLIDPGVVDRVIGELEQQSAGCDYASNVIQRTFPQGLDAEALFRDVLERVGRLARSAAAREHVTTYIRWEHPELFLIRSVTDVVDNSDLRWTVDTPADLVLVRRLYQELNLAHQVLPYQEVIEYVRRHPEQGPNN